MAAGPRRAPEPRRPHRPGTAAPPRRLRQPCPGTPHLAPPWPSWPGRARQRGRRGGAGGLGQEGSAVRRDLGKEGKELRGGSAALAQSLASGAAGVWWPKGPPRNPRVRDAPRPEQLEEQLCVRCGGVRIFAVAFGAFACFLRFPRQGEEVSTGGLRGFSHLNGITRAGRLCHGGELSP